MDKNKLFQTLFKSYTKAHPNKTKQESQKCVVELWTVIKESNDDFESEVAKHIKRYDALALKNKGTLMSFWSAQQSKKVEQPKILEEVLDGKEESTVENQEPEPALQKNQPKLPARVQEELKKQIDVLNSDLVGYYKRKSSGMLTETQEIEMNQKVKEKKKLEAELKKKINDQLRQKKSRENKKRKLFELCEAHPELKDSLKIPRCGRPRIEANQPELLKAIIDIAIHGSAAHESRQSDVYRSVKTLDELTDQLKRDGFSVSRSGVYLRLLPRKSSTLEGKRHVVTVPVKLIRAQNDMHMKHMDAQFCTANIRRLEEVASFLGPSEVCFLSQDDKARVPIGLTAAKKQSPLLMHVEYRIVLPDHDWVVAAKHKLIPSVYAGIEIQKDGFGKVESVGFSGPTYIAVRSGKHSSSTAYSHALDFERLLEIPEFDSITKVANTVKPVIILIVDGGPDENPRYQKTIQVAVHHFLQHQLDCIFVATNAPGRSAFNRVERRMAPLSKELSGLILPHEHYGSHLDGNGRTIDPVLEEKNFQFAGETLAEVWSSVVIDECPTVAEYIPPYKSELNPDCLKTKEGDWFANHVRTSQYLTQIVKCPDVECCGKARSSYFTIVPTRFFPAPIPLCQTGEGLKAPDVKSDGEQKFPSLFVSQLLRPEDILPSSLKQYKVLPYDLYCPSVQDLLKNRICKICSIYFASHVMLKKHVQRDHKSVEKNHHIFEKVRPVRVAARRQRELMAVISLSENVEFVDWMDESDVDTSGLNIPDDDGSSKLPVFSMNEHMSSPWEEN